jgi:hypothetical protein
LWLKIALKRERIKIRNSDFGRFLAIVSETVSVLLFGANSVVFEGRSVDTSF